MTTHPRLSTYLLAPALLVALAGPALAGDAPDPEMPATPQAAGPADAPAESGTERVADPAPDSALAQSSSSQLGDCLLSCDGEQVTYSSVTRDECCSGSLTCPDGSQPAWIGFVPYDGGFGEFCDPESSVAL